MLFQDPAHSLTTGSFTLFAVACLNDQSEVGCGQFSVLRGCHHAMERFYQMQVAGGGSRRPAFLCLRASLFLITWRVLREGCTGARARTRPSPQVEEGGIVGPEGPGWPRISPMVPVAVRVGLYPIVTLENSY